MFSLISDVQSISYLDPVEPVVQGDEPPHQDLEETSADPCLNDVGIAEFSFTSHGTEPCERGIKLTLLLFHQNQGVGKQFIFDL
jgi:hypothetical protein